MTKTGTTPENAEKGLAALARHSAESAAKSAEDTRPAMTTDGALPPASSLGRAGEGQAESLQTASTSASSRPVERPATMSAAAPEPPAPLVAETLPLVRLELTWEEAAQVMTAFQVANRVGALSEATRELANHILVKVHQAKVVAMTGVPTGVQKGTEK